MRDLNFVLRSEIFVHSEGKLRVSHLILGIDLVYTTWQNFSQALLVDSLLLLYIDVRHANLLPPSLMVGEARDLGLWYTTADSLAPIRDALVDLVSQNFYIINNNHRISHSQAPHYPVKTTMPKG